MQRGDPRRSAQHVASHPLVDETGIVQIPQGRFSPRIFIQALDDLGLPFRVIYLTHAQVHNVENFPRVVDIFQFVHLEGGIKLQIPFIAGADNDSWEEHHKPSYGLG
jgi:hypothetical protein